MEDPWIRWRTPGPTDRCVVALRFLLEGKGQLDLLAGTTGTDVWGTTGEVTGLSVMSRGQQGLQWTYRTGMIEEPSQDLQDLPKVPLWVALGVSGSPGALWGGLASM